MRKTPMMMLCLAWLGAFVLGATTHANSRTSFLKPLLQKDKKCDVRAIIFFDQSTGEIEQSAKCKGKCPEKEKCEDLFDPTRTKLKCRCDGTEVGGCRAVYDFTNPQNPNQENLAAKYKCEDVPPKECTDPNLPCKKSGLTEAEGDEFTIITKRCRCSP